MKRLLLAIGALLAHTGAAHASQAYCAGWGNVEQFSPVHTSGLASTAFSTPVSWPMDPLQAWCPLANGGETYDGAVLSVTGVCIASTGSAFREITRTAVAKIASGALSIVSMGSGAVSIGSASLETATFTLTTISSGSYLVPVVTGVASAEIDWDCKIVGDTFRPAIP